MLELFFAAAVLGCIIICGFVEFLQHKLSTSANRKLFIPLFLLVFGVVVFQIGLML
jgi:hypothetical protein